MPNHFKKAVRGIIFLTCSFQTSASAEELGRLGIMNSDFRTNVLSKIHSNLYGSKSNLMFLGTEVRQLISLYKDYLKSVENNVDQQESIDNARLLLTRLEKETQNWSNDARQMAFCYDLISTIESILYKLDNVKDSFDVTALPLEKMAIVDPYKKLQGEKLPYQLAKKKKDADWNELSPLPVAQLKIISSPSSMNSVEEDLEEK